MTDTFKTGINYFSEFMCEAIQAFLTSKDFLEEALETHPERDLEKNHYLQSAGYHARYAFLTAANALESAANALILNVSKTKTLYEELEKLGTLLKFELFCISKGKQIDRGNMLYSCIKEVIKCRNEFMHPKPSFVGLEEQNDEITFVVKKTKIRNYPLYLGNLEPASVEHAIRDILGFISWIVFDTCGYDLKEGSFLIGNGTSGIIGFVYSAAEECGFDLRPFGTDSKDLI